MKPTSKGYLFALIVCAIATGIGLLLRGHLDPVNLVMLYLLGVVLVAAQHGRAASTWAAIVSAFSFDFFLVEPYYSFAISDIQYVITFLVLLTTGLVISAQTSKLTAQSEYFKTKERHTSALYTIARELASARGQENMLPIICRHAQDMFDGTATLWLWQDEMRCATDISLTNDLKEKRAALSAYEDGKATGLETSTLPGARGYYIPFKGSEKILAVLGIFPKAGMLEADEKLQLEALANVAASALERVGTAEIAEKHKVEAEGEKLRNALLSSVSHDFRTPLASIKGSISGLMMDNNIPLETQKELLTGAHNEVSRLERMVSNLLDITVLESGKLTLKKDYYFMAELVGNAMARTADVLKEHKVECGFDEKIPALWVDGVLIEQVLVNLLENAAKYTPPGSEILIDAWIENNNMRVIVADRGPGIASGEEQKLFDKFYRGSRSGQGNGLGLTICKGIIEAHGGKISARNREGGGTVFSFTLPAGDTPYIMDEL